MDSIESIAQRAGIAGVPWDALSTRLNGADPIFDSAYLYEYLIPAADAATAIFKKYQFWPTPAEVQGLDVDAVKAYQGAASVLNAKAGTVIAAANRGTTELSTADAVTMPLVTYRVNVITAYDTALYGATMHVGNLQLLKSVTALVTAGKMTPDAASAFVKSHADSCYRTFRAIALLERSGAFAVVPKAPGPGAPQSGLGLAPVAIVAALVEGGPVGWALIAILSVAVIGLVYALVYYIRTTAEQNQQALDIIQRNCAAAADAKDWATVQQCNKLATDARKGLTDKLVDAFASTFQKAIPWLVGAGLLIGGVYFAPLVVRKLGEARKVARAS